MCPLQPPGYPKRYRREFLQETQCGVRPMKSMSSQNAGESQITDGGGGGGGGWWRWKSIVEYIQ